MTKILFLTLVFFSACKASQKAISLTEYKDNIISFSTGGGFTGEETTYYILENGQLYVEKGVVEKSTKLFSTLSKKETKVLFEKASKLNWSKQINASGNIYHTIAFGKYNESKKIIWGNNQESPSEDILKFYTELNSIIKNK